MRRISLFSFTTGRIGGASAYRRVSVDMVRGSDPANREVLPGQLRLLVNVGYSSHVSLSVELDCDDMHGGALFQWAVDETSGGFMRRFKGLSEWLARLAALISGGSYQCEDRDHGPWLLVPDP